MRSLCAVFVQFMRSFKNCLWGEIFAKKKWAAIPVATHLLNYIQTAVRLSRQNIRRHLRDAQVGKEAPA